MIFEINRIVSPCRRPYHEGGPGGRAPGGTETTKERVKEMSENKNAQSAEIQEILKKIDEYNELIDNAENALDAAIENLEEALAEAYGGDLE